MLYMSTRHGLLRITSPIARTSFRNTVKPLSHLKPASGRTMATASHIELTPSTAGSYHVPDIKSQSCKLASELLDKNHEKNHMYFNDDGFHNHIVHHLLTILALGATPEEIQRGFENNDGYQRPQAPLKQRNVEDMSDRETFKKFLGKQQYFHDFTEYFAREIDKKGWQATLKEHLFAGDEHSETLLKRMFAGFYHPIIHLGFGVEFEQPAIIAEALAQAATHDVWIAKFIDPVAEAAKKATQSKSLVQLIHEAKKTEKLATAAHWSDGNKVRDGVIARAGKEMIDLAAQWSVKPDELDKKTAEMMNAAIYFTGAAQRREKVKKIDFYFMHCTNSSIFFPVFAKQDWLSVEERCRLLEMKGRIDLAMYVSRRTPELMLDEIREYKPKKPEDGWAEIFRRIDKFEDDGHASKLIRALARGEEVCKPYENEGDDVFPIKGKTWLQLGHVAIDSVERGGDTWVRSAGFDEAWEKVPAAKL